MRRYNGRFWVKRRRPRAVVCRGIQALEQSLRAVGTLPHLAQGDEPQAAPNAPRSFAGLGPAPEPSDASGGNLGVVLSMFQNVDTD
jgi:hypothetical protein